MSVGSLTNLCKFEALRFFRPETIEKTVRSKKTVQNIVLSNIEISCLIKRGYLDSARHIFDGMPDRTVVSWNAIISGFSKWGRFEESLSMVSCMHRSETRLNETTFSSALSSCARSGSFGPGKQLHCLVFKSGSEDFKLVGSALLNLYTSSFEINDALLLFESLCCRNSLLWGLMLVGFVKCDMMEDALELFHRMPSRDVVSWTALISGYSGSFSAVDLGKALELFVFLVRSREAIPNEFTYDTILRVCTKLESLDFGTMVHACLLRCGFESDSPIGGALIEFYCHCDAVEDAHQVFEEMSSPCSTISKAIIAGLLSAGRIVDAEIVFGRMLNPCPFSYNQMIKAYAQVGRMADAKSLFDKMPCKNIVSLNTMITVYHKAGEFEQSLRIFDSIKEENNTVTWNSMISGFVQNEEPVEALKLYTLMQYVPITSSRSTFSALLRACASIGTLKQGMMLHAQLCKSPFGSNVYCGTSLVDMYAKCGNIVDAKVSFLEIVSPNVASWTALINGLAQHGSGTEAVLEFGRMVKQGIEPNVVTFVGLIMACCREGMVDEGMKFFRSMEKCYGLAPTVEHYACVVDLLCRSGRIREAEDIILDMPIEADGVIWGSLLNACWFFMDLEVGERVAWRLLCLNSKHISTHVVMSNIYAKLGRWEEVMKVRKRLRGLDVKKDPGCSWIEVKDTVHVFCVEDNSHPERDGIYSILEDLASNFNFYSDHCEHYCYQKFNNLIPSIPLHLS
ncbi:putative pentatricopeptide repeat-containing protein At5g59200, chloroplastic [Dendrobium catenatum]|uniref:Pentatricopeptide repeat-containing protein n=1 Tax=Dendrobium catenatum TaxID=906689 RepID=A0A2I0WHY4_9ASPA|nr:putative pentatricopeptide repeat-containing protein At5g59200, chloroplastic [Dendrobium catenatum]PKU75275.1 Pentatricopeptide repeat-containing protein [Dendrobium catenatum]